MKLPALAIAAAFALGIACGLNPEIAYRSRSHAFIRIPSLWRRYFPANRYCFRGSLANYYRGTGIPVVLGNARHGWSLH
jgi:hypothetical protein